MTRVIIVGNLAQVDFSDWLGKEIFNFLNQDDCSVFDFVPTYDGLIEKVEQNPNSIIVYCPTRIPEKVFKKLRQEIDTTRKILSEYNCTIGYLRIKEYKVVEINFSFNHSGYINKSFNPRKKVNTVAVGTKQHHNSLIKQIMYI